MNELISIIVPVYNVEKYLDRCVASLTAQTYENIEIILVDDGSPDGSPVKCDEWAGKDSRVKVIHKENGGALSARFAGIKEAKGEYVCFADADDWLARDMCEYLEGLTHEYDADVYVAEYFETSDEPAGDKEHTEIKVGLYRGTEDIYEGIARGDFSLISMWGKLIKKSLFDGLYDKMPTDLVMSEDIMCVGMLYTGVKLLVKSDKIGYYYFRHDGSALQRPISYRMIDDSVKAYEMIENSAEKSGRTYDSVVSMRIKNCLFLINSIIRNNACRDRYGKLRKYIKDHKAQLKSSPYLTKKQKSGGLLLCTCSPLYDLSIKIRTKIRGY